MSIMAKFQTKKQTGAVNLRAVPQALSQVGLDTIKKYEHALSIATKVTKLDEIPVLVNLVNTIRASEGLEPTNLSFVKKQKKAKKPESDNPAIRINKVQSILKRHIAKIGKVNSYSANTNVKSCLSLLNLLSRADFAGLLKYLKKNDCGLSDHKIKAIKSLLRFKSHIESFEKMEQGEKMEVDAEFFNWLKEKGINLCQLRKEYEEKCKGDALKRSIEQASPGQLIGIISQYFKGILEFQEYCKENNIKLN